MNNISFLDALIAQYVDIQQLIDIGKGDYIGGNLRRAQEALVKKTLLDNGIFPSKNNLATNLSALKIMNVWSEFLMTSHDNLRTITNRIFARLRNAQDLLVVSGTLLLILQATYTRETVEQKILYFSGFFLCTVSYAFFYIQRNIINKRKKTYNKRFNIKPYVLILLPPMILSIYYLDKPLVQPSSAKAMNINIYMEFSDTDISSIIYREYINQITVLNSDEWYVLPSKKKLDFFQILVNIESTILNLKMVPPKIASNKLEDSIGEYDYIKNMIIIDIEYLKYAPIEKCIAIICHEVRHAFQSFCIKRIDNWIDDKIFYENVRIWQLERTISIDLKNNYEMYFFQNQEQDARKFSFDRSNFIVALIKNYENK